VVTGASRGIGLAIARLLAREGASLVLVARDRRALEAAAELIGSKAVPRVADVTRPDHVVRLFTSLRKQHGHLDVLVNNAGVFTYKPFVRTTLREWQKNIDTNLTSLFLTTRAALPLFALKGGTYKGHVVNILSIASRQAFPNCSAYSASKFGGLGFTQVLATELRSQGIRVTAILPGSTNTRMKEEFGFPVDGSKLVQPEDVAQAVLAALRQPSRVTADEIVLTPSQGPL